MLSSQLLELSKILTESQLCSVKQYIDAFTTNTKISLTRFSIDTELEISLSKKILKLLSDWEIVKANFAIRCPNCGMILEYVDNFVDIDINMDCYSCNNEIEITTEDVEVIYTVKNIPFVRGQRNKKEFVSTSVVHAEDTLETFLYENNYNINKICYNPTDEEFSILTKKYNSAFDAKTTTEKGCTLENLVITLFNVCKHFEATGALKPRPNQIDCYIRNKLCNPGVPGLGCVGSFSIECKNENEKPSITYANKMHSILMNTGMKFGIIVSKLEVPKTYTQIVNKIYLNDKIIIISMDKVDLENVILNKKNLLDLIEMKVNEVKLDATKPLAEIGLYRDLTDKVDL